VEPRGLEPLTPCLQSKCATNCAMAPVGRGPIPRERPGRPTMVRHRDWPVQPLETSLQMRCLERFHAQRLAVGLAWSEVFSETANKFSKSPPSGGEERSSTPSASRKFPLGGDSAKDHTGSPSGRTPTYSVGHVVPARGHRLRAAATLHASSAAAARPPPGAARGLRC
jgi:hypothetical protein